MMPSSSSVGKRKRSLQEFCRDFPPEIVSIIPEIDCTPPEKEWTDRLYKSQRLTPLWILRNDSFSKETSKLGSVPVWLLLLSTSAGAIILRLFFCGGRSIFETLDSVSFSRLCRSFTRCASIERQRHYPSRASNLQWHALHLPSGSCTAFHAKLRSRSPILLEDEVLEELQDPLFAHYILNSGNYHENINYLLFFGLQFDRFQEKLPVTTNYYAIGQRSSSDYMRPCRHPKYKKHLIMKHTMFHRYWLSICGLSQACDRVRPPTRTPRGCVFATVPYYRTSYPLDKDLGRYD